MYLIETQKVQLCFLFWVSFKKNVICAWWNVLKLVDLKAQYNLVGRHHFKCYWKKSKFLMEICYFKAFSHKVIRKNTILPVGLTEATPNFYINIKKVSNISEINI